ncbi:MAG: PQQ-binding-like beta-propeller repeat protein [Phycisphaerae bacterium]
MMRPMKAYLAGIVSFGVTFAVGAAAIALWVTRPVGYDLPMRVPGRDRPAGSTGQDVPEKVQGKLETFDVRPPKVRGSWPGFRGPSRENISDDMTELARTWPEGGPPVLWSMEVGEGFAGPAILDGRVYLHDFDAARRSDVIRCMSLADGRDIWRYSYKIRIKRWHGVSRTVPAVTEKYLLALGPKCHVTCLDSNSGELRWAIDLVREYGTTVPQWYAAQCPLIDDGNAILAPAGETREVEDPNGQITLRGRDVLMTAINCETGKVVWEVPNPDGWEMTHSSIAVVELEDYTRLYVYCTNRGVVGVSADRGEVLWKTTEWKMRTIVPTPVPVGDGRVFLCAGYGAGSMMIQIVKEQDQYVPKTLFRLPPGTFGSVQQTPIFYKNHLFGNRPDEQFACLSTRGQVVWTSGPDRRFGKEGGAYMIADDLIFALDDEGMLTLMQATPQSYQQLARAKVLPGPYAWGPMALVAGRLIVRDLEHMVCLDVSKKK